MKNKTRFAFTTLMLLICIYTSQFFTKFQDDSIMETCRKYHLQVSMCVHVLRSDPRSASAKDFKYLVQISLDVCISYATETLNVIKNLQAKDQNLK